MRSPRSLARPTLSLTALVALSTPAAAATSDGSLTVATPGVVLNTYATVSTAITAGGDTLVLDDAAALDDTSSTPFSSRAIGAGTVLAIYQAQGAKIDTTDTKAFGTVTDRNGAGGFELVVVARVEGNTVTIDRDEKPGGFDNDYDPAGRIQVVRVPMLEELTITSSGSVTAPSWDGAKGGLVVVSVSGAVLLDGEVDVSGKGFRGAPKVNNETGYNYAGYRSNTFVNGAQKGEGVAGSWTDLAAASVHIGRGAPANAGGGGNAHNAAGGGGANGDSGAAWNGWGVMRAHPAWPLDPAYISFGGLTKSAGGGRGGYSFGGSNQNALAVPPGDSRWGGDWRREIGGLGGRPVANDPLGILFLGGGGGAGSENNGRGGSGGAGGGLVFLVSRDGVSGSGAILVDGANGQTAPGNDGAGGAGAGGTVVVIAPSVDDIEISSLGGDGGDQIIRALIANESEGPGGGGGGGYVALPEDSDATVSIAGGVGGTTDSAALTEFPTNGATDGGDGELGASPAFSDFGLCLFIFCDSDGDGLSDAEERRRGTDPFDPDTDGDGLSDGDEVLKYGTDPLDADTDGDGLSDGDEVLKYGTDPLDADTDGDGLEDGAEVYIFGTDPLNPDTDGDGLEDGAEVFEHGTDPTNPDTDGDGLTDGDEVLIHGTDPTNPDTDGDGLTDGDEVLEYDTDPLNPDTDGDGLEDGEEILQYGTDPLNPDTDGDGLTDGDEVAIYRTDPLDPDTDGGGVHDGDEVARGTDPLDPCDDPPEEPCDPDDTDDPSDTDDPVDPGDGTLYYQGGCACDASAPAGFGGGLAAVTVLLTFACRRRRR